ncbi:MAG: hypothetical protein JSR61_01065 [Proteobacteria bacterium]|nr:hypothetical protein [Pseudomonadota bacterium]
MTAARQRRKRQKQRGRLLASLAGAVLLPLLALAAVTVPGRANPGPRAEPIVVNPDSGLAISGFDPVAYFSRGEAVLGLPELELGFGGVVWRFVNVGNRSAFSEHPEVYAPQFGGYDPVAIGRGTAVAGHPLIWAINGERLYLFYDNGARSEFLADPARIIERASQKWPGVAHGIAR